MQQAENTVQQEQVTLTSAEASLQETKQPETSAQIDQDKATVAQAQAGLQTAQSNLQTAEQTVANLTLKAPISGVITAVNGQVGQPVSTSQPMVSLNSDSKTGMQLNLQVPESSIGLIKNGDPLTFTVTALSGQTFTGQVVQVYPTPTTTNNVSDYTVIAQANNPDGKLLAGMTANVTIQTATANHVIAIPAVSLVNVGSVEGVYVIGSRPSGFSSGGFVSRSAANQSTSGGGASGGTFATGSRTGSGGAPLGRGNGTGGPLSTGSGLGKNSGGSLNGSASLSGLRKLANFGNAPAGTYFQPVQVGLFGTNTVQITSGLTAGEKILAIPPGSASAAVTSSSSSSTRGGLGGGFGGFGGGFGGASSSARSGGNG